MFKKIVLSLQATKKFLHHAERPEEISPCAGSYHDIPLTWTGNGCPGAENRPAGRTVRQQPLAIVGSCLFAGAASSRIHRTTHPFHCYDTHRHLATAGVVLGCRILLRPSGLRAGSQLRTEGVASLSGGRQQAGRRRLSQHSRPDLRAEGRVRAGGAICQAVQPARPEAGRCRQHRFFVQHPGGHLYESASAERGGEVHPQGHWLLPEGGQPRADGCAARHGLGGVPPSRRRRDGPRLCHEGLADRAAAGTARQGGHPAGSAGGGTHRLEANSRSTAGLAGGDSWTA